ncbi:MAG TPA: hypothetical protein VFV29_08850, partial [Actinomycetota bacterium]|nr:hypothetical protein [Actinomycetota bacterium]
WEKGRRLALRPMRVGETLDAAINLYRMHWKTFMAIVAIVSVPFVFLQHLSYTLIGTSTALTESPAPDANAGAIVGVTFAFAALDFLLVRPFLTAGIVRAVAAAYLGEEPAVAPVYAFAAHHFASILWVLLLVVLAIGAVFVAAFGFSVMFLAVGATPLIMLVMLAAAGFAVVLYIRWLFGPSVLVVEGLRGRAALTRSWRLSSKAFWKVAGTMVLGSILTSLIGGILAIVPSLLSTPLGSAGWLLRAAGSSLAAVVTTPFITMVAVLLYFDQRIRKEGMDLAIMSRELDTTAGL